MNLIDGRSKLIRAPHVANLRLRQGGAPVSESATVDAFRASSFTESLGSATGAARTRGLWVMLVALAIACNEPATSDTQPSQRNPAVSTTKTSESASVEESAREPDRIHLADFCPSQRIGATREYLTQHTSEGSGDVSGFTISLRRVSGSEWVVSGSEAIGSFGPAEPVRAASFAAETGVLGFALATARIEQVGPRLALKMSCDSLWGTAQDVFVGAPEYPVVLRHVPGIGAP